MNLYLEERLNLCILLLFNQHIFLQHFLSSPACKYSVGSFCWVLYSPRKGTVQVQHHDNQIFSPQR